MTSMVEKVAQAIRDNLEAALPLGVTLSYEYAAYAAIEAMREPTEAMLNAAREADSFDIYLTNAPAEIHWKAMISASLLPPQSEE